MKKIKEISYELFALACGLDPQLSSYTNCIMNGVEFHTKSCEQHHCTENSGIIVDGWHDSNLIEYYGVVTDILELHYMGGYNVYLFCCDWWEIKPKKGGIQIDGHYISVNT